MIRRPPRSTRTDTLLPYTTLFRSKATAEKIGAIFTEVIVAPEADEDAKALLAAKKNLRLLLTGGMADPLSPGWFVKSVAGGYLAQTRAAGRITEAELKIGRAHV